MFDKIMYYHIRITGSGFYRYCILFLRPNDRRYDEI